MHAFKFQFIWNWDCIFSLPWGECYTISKPPALVFQYHPRSSLVCSCWYQRAADHLLHDFARAICLAWQAKDVSPVVAIKRTLEVPVPVSVEYKWIQEDCQMLVGEGQLWSQNTVQSPVSFLLFADNTNWLGCPSGEARNEADLHVNTLKIRAVLLALCTFQDHLIDHSPVVTSDSLVVGAYLNKWEGQFFFHYVCWCRKSFLAKLHTLEISTRFISRKEKHHIRPVKSRWSPQQNGLSFLG